MSVKHFLVVCLLLAAIPQQIYCQDVNISSFTAYTKWRFQFKRQYLNDDERVYRQQIFLENLKKIENHKKNKDATYDIGLNQFSDMTKEEFSQRMLNNKLSDEMPINGKVFDGARGLRGGLAQSVDWRTKGVVTPIKDQKGCGSCWAFATVGVLESFNAIKNGKLIQFSEQQIIDCATFKAGYYGFGCQGGYPSEALNYAKKNGIVTAAQYPYLEYKDVCKVDGKSSTFYPKAFQSVDRTVDAMKAALNIAPVVVLVNAPAIHDYKSGIFNGCGETESSKPDHAVVAVGYDSNGNWIIKNSWGTSWGEAGYIRLAPGNTCGILLNSYVVTA